MACRPHHSPCRSRARWRTSRKANPSCFRVRPRRTCTKQGVSPVSASCASLHGSTVQHIPQPLHGSPNLGLSITMPSNIIGTPVTSTVMHLPVRSTYSALSVPSCAKCGRRMALVRFVQSNFHSTFLHSKPLLERIILPTQAFSMEDFLFLHSSGNSRVPCGPCPCRFRRININGHWDGL